MIAYSEVIASTQRALFTLKIFTNASLDPIAISLIEESFEVKSTNKKYELFLKNTK